MPYDSDNASNAGWSVFALRKGGCQKGAYLRQPRTLLGSSRFPNGSRSETRLFITDLLTPYQSDLCDEGMMGDLALVSRLLHFPHGMRLITPKQSRE